MKSRQILKSFAIAAFTFFGLNYSWSHAAIVGVLNNNSCGAELINDARASVKSLIGKPKSDPFFICLDGPFAGLNVQYGTTRFAPLFPSLIVLGPLGQNSDVASHEFVHAELAERTSVLLRTYKIPTWFDEG